jgi:3-phenylpropionate/trans-cinnamate dioxygenase ferredoxin subunit
MAFHKVGKLSDLGPGTAKLVEAGGRQVAVFNVDGDLYALDDYCSHEEGSLSEGELIGCEGEPSGCEIECPIHGARYDLRTGKVTQDPAVLPVDTFAVRVSDGDIEIDV